jgi:hypothetical protein
MTTERMCRCGHGESDHTMSFHGYAPCKEKMYNVNTHRVESHCVCYHFVAADQPTTYMCRYLTDTESQGVL